MKELQIFFIAVLAVSILSGCGGGSKRVSMPAGTSRDIAVVSLGADTSQLSADQIALLNRTLTWMDRNLMQVLKKRGCSRPGSMPNRISPGLVTATC